MRHRPNYFLDRVEMDDMRYELKKEYEEKAGIPAISAKKGVGTFVVKELVYAYAMWISAAFHLKVIRFFDRGMTEGVAVADHAVDNLLDDPLAYFEKVLAQAKQLKAERDAAQAQLAVTTNERDGLAETVGTHMHTVARFARTLTGVNSMKIKADLQRAGFLYRPKLSAPYRVYRKYSDLFVEKFHSEYGTVDIYVTEQGKTTLARLYQEDALTMLKHY